MELRQLRSFCMAAKVQSISRAAERLDLGQPAVTTHIKRLEVELGASLFDRGKRPIQLTSTGNTLADLATPLVEAIDDLVARTASAEKQSPVTVGATYDIVPHVLLQAVRDFRLAHPTVRLYIRSGHRDGILQMIRDREVDIGIIPGKDTSRDLAFTRLFSYDTVLITPLGHPLLERPLESLAEIARYPLIMMEQQTLTRSLLESEFQSAALDYEIVMELGNMNYIKRYVASGLGISVGPRLAIEPEDRNDLGVIGLSHLFPEAEAGYATLARRMLPNSVDLFVQSLAMSLGEN